jgi:hypothetical protein
MANPIQEGLNSKRAAVWLVVIVVGLLGLNVGSYLLGLHNLNVSNANNATIHQVCMRDNELRRQQVVLWQHMVVIMQPRPGETRPERASRLREMQAISIYVDRAFAPHKCP